MLSVDQCKKCLKNASYTEREIEEIRDNLSQLAEMLVSAYLRKRVAKDDRKERIESGSQSASFKS